VGGNVQDGQGELSLPAALGVKLLMSPKPIKPGVEQCCQLLFGYIVRHHCGMWICFSVHFAGKPEDTPFEGAPR
jgi:hypothetical protein